MDVTIPQIKAASLAALKAYGAADWQAEEVAKAVARAEETGNIICGLYYLESYCIQLASGRVNGTVEPDVKATRPGAIAVDARFGFAQPAFARALPVAIKAAQDNGIATLAVGHSHTCTSLGYFTEQIAAAGLIGIGMTNASAIVSAPGGKKPILGTNPIAFSVPGDGAPAMHADFSTAAVALGKITMAKAAGESIPLGWAVDKDGNPTTDPAAALQGSLCGAADYKGWALGLLVELLAAGLTGSVGSLDVKGLKLAEGKPHDLGQFYILIDPAGHTNTLAERLNQVVTAIGDEPNARIPGSPRRRLETVSVDPGLWDKIEGLAQGPA